MTMHLARGLTTTRTTKIKHKQLSKKELDEHNSQWRQYNKKMRQSYLHSCQIDTLEEYIKYTKGGMKVSIPKGTFASGTANMNTNHKIPSKNSNIKGALAKQQSPVYSGERKLVGIAVMHKSNLVPVFEDESGSARKEAAELATMRR